MIALASVLSQPGDDPSLTDVVAPEDQPTTTASVDTTSPADEPAAITTRPTTATTAEPTTTTAKTADTVNPGIDATLARARLSSLTVADPDPGRAPYVRDEYEPGGWADFDGDCLSTRHELLLARSATPPELTCDGCRVETGEWIDPYTGETLTSAEVATIDHLVPLAEAHRAGAWRWDQDTKIRFANDTESPQLRIVAGDVNQSKADSTPDKWLPPREDTWCSYAADWIEVKDRWQLTVTATEAARLQQVLENCESSVVRPQAAVNVPPVIRTTTSAAPTTTTTTTTTTQPSRECHPAYASPCLAIVSDLNCGDIGRLVVLVDPSNDPYRLDGDSDGYGCESYG